MSETNRIGEVLLMRESIDPLVLAQALRGQRVSRHRLVSELINRAQLDADDGALALSEQSGYPAALTRHVERRDPKVAELIPRALIQRWCVVPLAWAQDGRLVVIARDPTPILAAALEHAARTPVFLAIVPEIHIERLIRSIYGVEAAAARETDASSEPVAGIEDIRVSREAERRDDRARTVTRSFALAEPDLPPLRGRTTTGRRLDAVLTDIDRAVTFGAVERLVMSYAEVRWQASLVLNVVDRNLIGHRGHGERVSALESIVLPLDAPSIAQAAIQTGVATAHGPGGPIQDRIKFLLGDSAQPTAAPVFFGSRLCAVILVGDPRAPSGTESIVDLGQLADALSGAHERFSRPSR